MSENREEDWAQLEARAFRLLEHAKEVEPRPEIRRYGSLLRLWRFPAFDAQKTWTILTPGRKSPPEAPPVVREVTWDRRADHQRLFDSVEGFKQGAGTEPTIRLREGVLPSRELQRILSPCAELAVPLLLSCKVNGIDGELFGLETYEYSPSIRLQWWCEGPVEWRHFTDWVAALRAFLLHCLDQTG